MKKTPVVEPETCDCCREWDGFLPVDWRAQDAESLLAGGETTWANADDAVVSVYADYLKAHAGPREALPATAARSSWSAIAKASEIAEQDDLRQWQLKARLLARQADAEIADRLGLPAEAITWFERLFFSVRDCLDARSYISNQVIGSCLQDGFNDRDVGPFWLTVGYYGPSGVLDAVLDAFRTAWRPGDPIALSVYLRPDIRIDPRIQANVAALVLPRNDRVAGALFELHIQFQEANLVEDQDRRAVLRERVAARLVRCAVRFLAGKPLPQFRRWLPMMQGAGPQKPGRRGAKQKGISYEALCWMPLLPPWPEPLLLHGDGRNGPRKLRVIFFRLRLFAILNRSKRGIGKT